MKAEGLDSMQSYGRNSIRGATRYGWPTGFALAFLLAVLMSGCAVGPDYIAPATDVASGWIEADESLSTLEPPTDPKWWKNAFQDPDINQLVEEALAQNLTLRSAGLRVLQAQQLLAIAVGYQFPQQQQVSGSAAREKLLATTFNKYTLGFNVGWEIDFWGRFRRQVESRSAELDASVAGYDGVLISLAAQVARTYILIRTYQDRMEVVRNNIQLQGDGLRIAQAKADAGAVSELDVDQAKALLNGTKASLGTIEISLQQSRNALAVLLGKAPYDIGGLLVEKRDIPTVRADVALGMPQDLIRRRPDLRIAERQLAAQSAQIGVSITELYPHLSIGGSIGTRASQTSDLFQTDSQTWSIFGGFAWNIFNYGRLKSNIRLQDALFQQLLVDYRNTVLEAQVDVENAIVAFLITHEQLGSYKLAAEASQRAVDISNAQYKEGLVDYNTVISTLASHLQRQEQLSIAQGNAATSLVQVYKSLGGGWEIRANRDPVDLLPLETKEEMLNRTRFWKGILQ